MTPLYQHGSESGLFVHTVLKEQEWVTRNDGFHSSQCGDHRTDHCAVECNSPQVRLAFYTHYCTSHAHKASLEQILSSTKICISLGHANSTCLCRPTTRVKAFNVCYKCGEMYRRCTVQCHCLLQSIEGYSLLRCRVALG
jgi:hypothetical protein